MLILEYCALSAGSKPIDEVPTQVTYQPGKTGARAGGVIFIISISAGIWICIHIWICILLIFVLQ